MDFEDYKTSIKDNHSIIIPHDCYLKGWKLRLTWQTGIINTTLINDLISPLHRINASLHRNQMINDPDINGPQFIDGLFYIPHNYCSVVLNTLIGQGNIDGFRIPTNAQRNVGYHEELTHTFSQPIFLHKNDWLDVKLQRNEAYALIEGAVDKLIPKVNFEFDIA